MAEVDAETAREQAREVLEGDRYQGTDVPRPLRGVLRWVGERVEDLGRPVVDALSTPQGMVVSGVALAVVTAIVVGSVVRRRNRQAEHHEGDRARRRGTDPRALEDEADDAEARGDLAAAVRLRFRAGVIRLEDAGAVPRRADSTTGRLVRDVPSAALPPLAATFDEVAYGGRHPGRDDVAAARRGWPQVLADVRARDGADGSGA